MTDDDHDKDGDAHDDDDDVGADDYGIIDEDGEESDDDDDERLQRLKRWIWTAKYLLPTSDND